MPIDSPDFPESVRRILRERAGLECSNPSCGAKTSTALRGSKGYASIGEACHISGARPNSARYDRRMSNKERSSIDNAIWLCKSCARLIDRDPEAHPSSLLHEWRNEHEGGIREEVTNPRRRRTFAENVAEGIGLHEIDTIAFQLLRPADWDHVKKALHALSRYSENGTPKQRAKAIEGLSNLAVYTRSGMPSEVTHCILDQCDQAAPHTMTTPSTFDRDLIAAADVAGHVGYDTALYNQDGHVLIDVASTLSRFSFLALRHRRRAPQKAINAEFDKCTDAANRATPPWTDAAQWLQHRKATPGIGPHRPPPHMDAVELRLLEHKPRSRSR